MSMRSTLSKLRPLRFLLAVFVATIVFFTYAFPALAISAPKSDPREGEAPINDIYQMMWKPEYPKLEILPADPQ